MPPSTVGDSVLFRLCLAAVTSFICLLWAVHLMESRNQNEQSAHGWKRLNNFVRVHISQHKAESVQRSNGVLKGIGFEESSSRSDHTIGFTQYPPLHTLNQSAINTPPDTSRTHIFHATTSSYVGRIYMDWVGDSDDFGYINYKSLESLLTVYPKSSIIVHLIASNGAQYYKMGNLISKHFFQKYLKYGYNVQVKIMYTTYSMEHSEVMPLGAAYWNEQFLLCCTSERAADINKYRIIPAHLYFYLRFSKLYKTGGMYSDFSWYHIDTLLPLTVQSMANDTLRDGAVIQLSCYTNNNKFDKIRGINADVLDAPCMYRSSALLQFEKESVVLQCILAQYNATESTLLKCIEHDEFTDGAVCVKRSLLACFASTNTANAFDNINKLSKIAIWLGPSSYNGDWSFYNDSSEIAGYIQHNPLPVPGPYYKRQLIERDAASTIPYAPYPLRVLAAVTPQEQHYVHLLNTQQVTYIPGYNTSHVCPHFQYDKTLSLPIHMQNQAKFSCAPHFVIPGFMKAGTTYMFGTLMTHPMLLNALKGVTFKETGCYGSQYTTQLKQKNVLKNSLAKVYSNVYDAYTSSSAKTESTNLQTAYQEGIHRLQSTTNRYYNRMDCFPFVETHEKLYFGDGTVWYNSHKNIPAALLTDNPNIKVLFSIRNPVHRAESHHRFSYRTLVRMYTGDLNEIIQYLLYNDSTQHYGGTSLVELRAQAVEILHTTDEVLKTERIETLVENFQQRAPNDKKYKMLNQYIKFGIYFVPIYYWYKIIPNEHMAVLPVETLQPHKLSGKTKLSYLYNLTTLPQYNSIYHKYTTSLNAAARERSALHDKYASKRQAAQLIDDTSERTQALRQQEDELAQREAKISRKLDAVLNNEYLVHQYNRIFRFLELPEMTSITEADSHLTGDKDILPEHKLSKESQRLLNEYFQPFNMLLEEFLGESIGYDSII